GSCVALFARDESRRRELAERPRTTRDTRVEVVAADLSTPDGIDAIRQVIDSETVDVLINNAGYGLRGRLLETDIAELNDQDRVLTGAVRELSLAAAR